MESLVLDQLKKSRLNKGEWRTHCANDGHIIVPDPIFGRKDFQVPLVLRHVIEAPSMDDPDEVWDIAVVTYVDPNLDTRLVYQMKDLGVDGDPDEVMTAGIIYKDRGVIKYHNLS